MDALSASLALCGLSGVVTPGTVLAVTITHSTRLGFRAGPLVSGAIGGVGGAVILLGMAWSMLCSLPGLRLELEAGQAAGGLRGNAAPVKDGFLLSLVSLLVTKGWSLAQRAHPPAPGGSSWPPGAGLYKAARKYAGRPS